MSRIGKLPISIPAGVTVNYDNDSHVCTVKGPKGELSQWIDPSIKFINADGQISFEIDENSPVMLSRSRLSTVCIALSLTTWLLALALVIQRFWN